MAVTTVQDIVPDGAFAYHEPFIVVNHKSRDVGLVGWKNNRWTHQDKAHQNGARRCSAPLGTHAQAAECQMAWKQAFDPDSRRYYFYNRSTGTTSWEAPDAAFTPDDTVEYYLQHGIAEPWVRTKSKHKTAQSPEASATSMTTEPALPKSHVHAAALDGLIPAHVRFSPSKKGDLARDVERYWVLRYSLFSMWSSGVVLDEKSLFSVTPEVIAKHHAKMLCGAASVLDAFCGCGGNTIHLAAAFGKVIACETDKEQIAMAQRNCEVYGVTSGVTWLHGDVFKSYIEPVDAVFLSPPWGGPGADSCNVFDATTPVDGLGRSVKDCIQLACACLSQDSLKSKSTTADHPNVAVYLPRNTSTVSLQECLDIPGFQVTPLCLERNILNEKLKSATLYLHATSG